LDQSRVEVEIGFFTWLWFLGEEDESWAGSLATVDQPDIRGLVTDMT
jgi:hypothetical protein